MKILSLSIRDNSEPKLKLSSVNRFRIGTRCGERLGRGGKCLLLV